MRPTVYIIAGPNGAGKTTFAREYLPSHAECPNFINADRSYLRTINSLKRTGYGVHIFYLWLPTRGWRSRAYGGGFEQAATTFPGVSCSVDFVVRSSTFFVTTENLRMNGN